MGPRQPRRHGEVGGVLISILGESGQSLYRSGRGRVPFRPAFWRGGNQPTPRRTYGGRARRGRAVGLGRRVEPLGVLGIVPEALGGGSATPARHSTQHCWAASPGCPLFPPQSSAGYYFMKKSEGNLSRGEESRWKERKIWGSGDREERG